MNSIRFLKQFNWRFLLVRILVNAIALAITAAVTPKVYFVDKSVWSWLLIAVMLGILNALLKPVLQFLTLPFIFVTYGLVIVLVNALLLWLLSLLFPARFAVDNLLWALVGGLVLGLLSSFLESLLGLTMPIMPEEESTLRRQLEEQARGMGSLMVARRGRQARHRPTRQTCLHQGWMKNRPHRAMTQGPLSLGSRKSHNPRLSPQKSKRRTEHETNEA